MAKAIVKNSHFTLSGHNYFMGRAENIRLGTYGEKRASPLYVNYLDDQNYIPMLNFNIEKPTTVEIDFVKSKKTDFNLDANYKVANGTIGYSYENMKQGKLALIKMTVQNNELKDFINNDEDLLEEIKSYKIPRIANQVFVVVEASFAETFSSKADFKATYAKGILTVDAKTEAGASGKSTLTISQGTVFAYGIVKPVFNKDKSKITKFETDQWGMG
jgi:hypothetical protein